jgi:hypothetical protein
MLITFKSRSYQEVTMMDDLAKYLLAIVGKQLTERGVISHDETAGAIARLEAAIGVDKAATADHHAEQVASHNEIHGEEPVGLAQRAFPLLDMLRAAHRENSDVLWGV